MIKQLLVLVVILAVAAMPLAAQPREDIRAGESSVSVAVPPGPGYVPRQTVLHDNGPLVTHPGGGGGGADASVVQNVSLGMSTYGLANQGPASTGNRVADDFTIPAGETWSLSAITVFQHQTDAPTMPSPFSALNLQIWDGPPNVAGSSVVWGDLITDLLSASVWSGIYRVAENTPADTRRAIFANTAGVTATLGEGTYWIDYAPTGDITFAGPWAPPVTILGQTATGDALHYFSGVWGPYQDSATSAPQGVPFVVEGSVVLQPVSEIPTQSPAGLFALGVLLASGALFLLRRKG